MQDGHIQRRMITKNSQTAEEMQKEAQKQQAKALAEAEKRRAAVDIPAHPAALVDFFLNCDAADMEYFMAKTRASLDDGFFAALDGAIGQERFLPEPDQEKLEELEGLRDYVKQLLVAQDRVKQGVLSATERLKKLLVAKDKKQCILDMAANNELDVALMQLLQQNIDGATAAGQKDAAAFMGKIQAAAAKHVITPAKPSSEDAAREAVRQQLASQQQGEGPSAPGKLIMP